MCFDNDCARSFIKFIENSSFSTLTIHDKHIHRWKISWCESGGFGDTAVCVPNLANRGVVDGYTVARTVVLNCSSDVPALVYARLKDINGPTRVCVFSTEN